MCAASYNVLSDTIYSLSWFKSAPLESSKCLSGFGLAFQSEERKWRYQIRVHALLPILRPHSGFLKKRPRAAAMHGISLRAFLLRLVLSIEVLSVVNVCWRSEWC